MLVQKNRHFQGAIYQALTLLLALTLWFSPTLTYAMSVGEEKEKGREIAGKFLAQLSQTEDQAAREYIREIGQKIVAANQPQLFDFHFYLVDNKSINAFAIPGGYIFLHSGLVMNAESEEEVAGVIAHEIGHVTARHISQQISRSTTASLLSLAAILGAIFLAPDTKTAAAVSTAAMAGAASAQLKYSREMEEQADRLAFKYMLKTGYNPQGLLTFMKRIMGENIFADIIPSYLTTHPAPADRAIYLEGLISTYREKVPDPVNRKRFERIKTRLLVDQKSPEDSVAYFREEVQKAPDDANSYYGLGLAYQKMGKTADARDMYLEALKRSPGDRDVYRDLGYCQLLAGDPESAISYLKQAVGYYESEDLDLKYRKEGHAPDAVEGLALTYLGIAYKERGDFENAARVLQRAIVADPENREALYHLGVSLGNLNKKCRAFYFLGLYHKKIGDFRQARDYLERARGLCASEDDYRRKSDSELSGLKKNKKKIK